MKENDFIVIAQPKDTIEAGVMQSFLESQGMQVYVQGDASFGLGVSIPSLRLMVPKYQELEARGLLDQLKFNPDKVKLDSNKQILGAASLSDIGSVGQEMMKEHRHPTAFGRLPLSVHIPLMLIAPPVGGIVCSILVILYADQLKAMGVNAGIACVGGFILAAGALRFVFSSILRAQCPLCHACLKTQGLQPITYHCTECAFIRKTFVSECDN